jgi:hypothetical protein
MIEFLETMLRKDSRLPLQIGLPSIARVDAAPDEPRQRQPPRIVESDDELDARQRDVEPPPVRGVEHPALLRADRRDPAPLFVVGNLDPAGFPRQLVDGVPGDPRRVGDPLGESRLPRARHPVHENPIGHVL